MLQKLKELKELLDASVISKAEFEKLKNEIFTNNDIGIDSKETSDNKVAIDYDPFEGLATKNSMSSNSKKENKIKATTAEMGEKRRGFFSPKTCPSIT